MNADGMRNRSRDSIDRLGFLQGELNELAGYEINPNSPNQVKKYFYEHLGLAPYKFKGSITTNEGALKRIARKGYKEANILLEMRRIKKMDSTYFSMQLDSDDRLRCSMNPGRTSSGRLASSKTIFGTGANMQNQPPEMKRYMLVDVGFIGFNIDLAQAENRIVAYLGPDQTMIDAFEQDIDVHSLTASFIVPAFDITMSPEEIKEQDKLYTETRDSKYAAPIGQGNQSWRFWGKKANHAFNYGQWYKAFSYQVEIQEKDGKLIHERYHAAYPGVARMHNWVESDLRENGRTLQNLFGRRRTYRDAWESSLLLEAYSFIPQSTIADKINLQGLLFIYQNQELFAPLEILNQVHDSIVFQIRDNIGWEQTSEILMEIRRSLEAPLQFRGREFVIPLDIEMCGKNFKETVEIKDLSPDALEAYYLPLIT